MEKSTIQLPDTWLKHLKEEFNQDYMIKLKSKLLELKKIKLFFILQENKFLMRLI